MNILVAFHWTLRQPRANTRTPHRSFWRLFMSNPSPASRASPPRACHGLFLPSGAVRSWMPCRSAELHVKAGRLWVTLGGPYVGHANQLGDLVLEAGERLDVPARSRVVVEAWMASPSSDGVRFDWCEGTGAVREDLLAWAVIAPTFEMRSALRAVWEALCRLGRGALGWAGFGLAAWGRRATRR